MKTLLATSLSLIAILAALAVSAQDTLTLSGPEGVAFDSKDNLYIADTGNNRVLVFDPSMKLIMKIENTEGVKIQEPGQLRLPSDVAVDSKGRIIVTERGNHRVSIFSPEGKLIKTLGKKEASPDVNRGYQGTEDGEFNSPTHITIDDRDNMIITERWNHRIQVFNSNGDHLFTYANRTGKLPQEIIDKKKAEAKRPEDLKGNWDEYQKTDPGQLNEPGGTWYDSKLKRLYLGNGWNCRAEVFDYDSKTGVISARPEETGIVWGFWTIRSIAGDSRGNLIGADSNHANLRVFHNRADLTNKSKIDVTIDGGIYGRMQQVWDIAVNSKDEIAAADTAHNRVLIFPSDYKLPDNPIVENITSSGAEIKWSTLEGAPTKVRLLKANYPMNTKGYENLWITDQDNVRELTASKARKKEHDVKLTKLEPATRYYYKLCMPDLKSVPGSGWSREYAFATEAKKGETAYLAMPIKIVLYTNVIDAPSVEPDAPDPGKMTFSDLQLYKRDLKENQLFYWTNSSMKYLVDYDLYVDDTMHTTGTRPEDAPEWLKQLPEKGRSFPDLVEEAGNKDKIYFGEVLITAKRRWDSGKKEWSYTGSGGGTHGINWPAIGGSNFLGGSDIAWLMCHEYHHQVESQFGESGLKREDDRMIFCHFAPVHKNWDWSTAYNHGEHWDGIAYSLRVFKPSQYLRCLFGEIRTAKDADDDGIPDKDPSLPLDEASLGSDPAKADTDGDGLADMQEVLASKWVTCINAPLRNKISAGYIRPNLKAADTDGDGVPDGKDKYPIYPFKPSIPKATPTVDGDIAEWPEQPQMWMDSQGIKLKGGTAHDDSFLYIAFSVEGDYSDMNVVLDLDADGYYVGVDNLYMWISPDATNGPRLRDAKLHICNSETWPHFDKKQEGTGKHEYIGPEDLKWASSVKDGVQIFEVAIPKQDNIGLKLNTGEEIGLMVYIVPTGKSTISLFEPWSIFDMTLE